MITKACIFIYIHAHVHVYMRDMLVHFQVQTDERVFVFVVLETRARSGTQPRSHSSATWSAAESPAQRKVLLQHY